MNIEGKSAVVTGASRGVGRATALALARLGCHVLLVHRDSADDAQQVADQAQSLGVKAIVCQADVADDDACRAMAQTAEQQLGRVDVLVNNAGTTKFVAHSQLEQLSYDDWQRMMAVNVIGPYQCFRALAPMLRASQNADVVNVASIAGLSSPGSSIAYGASKAALINMTINLARAFGPDQIRVNAVAPGFITGQWLQAGLGDRYDEIKHQFERSSALGRVCQPDDVAAAILSIITGSDLVTGQTLVVDGGKRIGPPSDLAR